MSREQSHEAAAIRRKIAEHLAELESQRVDTDFLRGYRTGLRMAYLAAGGVVDGSEEQWAQVG